MLFRIDYERFLTHMIDHFPREILLSVQYAIISAGIRNMGRSPNCTKINELYPSTDITVSAVEYRDRDVLKKMYYDELEELNNTIYRAFVMNVLRHVDIIIVCRESENVYIDILCEYIKERYKLETINLNELFINGRVGSIFLDRKAIRNKSVDVRRECAERMNRELESTEGGRAKLLTLMTRKDKLKKLKELSIIPHDDSDLDQLLTSEWVEES